ncbi:MAG: diphosphomevalonate decarboxylase [Myxococcota bacterium]
MSERPSALSGALVLDGVVTARAGVNIALIKYWGKAPARGPNDANLPACPSVSLTLDGLYSETRARFAPDAMDDTVVLDGEALQGPGLDRMRPVLDRVRELGDIAAPFFIETRNTVPTAAGLASSASGAAALAAATARCAGLSLTWGELSAIARLGSGSGSRSVFGGWAAWDGPEARPIHPREHWDLAIVVALVSKARKSLSSREAMRQTARTSPLYGPWVETAQEAFDAALAALKHRDLAALIEAMETSTMRMHASAMGAKPPILYWKPASLAAIEVVQSLRAHGTLCGWTMDAGPNVKVLCRASDAAAVASALDAVAGVGSTLVCRPGPGVTVRVSEEG